MKARMERILVSLTTALSVIMLAQAGCPQVPPEDVQDMVVTEQMTKVLYHYGSIKPLLITIMDEGTAVKAHPTSDGWYKIWWYEKGKWKIGYVPDSCLMPVPDRDGQPIDR